MKKKNHLKEYLIMGITILGLLGCNSNGHMESTENDEIMQIEVDTEGQKQESQEVVEVNNEKVADSYEDILGKYSIALSEQWNMGDYYGADMSPLSIYCYEGNPQENVGYALLDLDKDGLDELLIGAISGDEFVQQIIFEMYTLEDGKPVQAFMSQERDRFYLGVDETGAYIITNEGSAGAGNSAWHYGVLEEGRLKMGQAVIFAADANEDNPWYRSCDNDWDVSNDESISEELAQNIISSYEEKRITPEYVPFILEEENAEYLEMKK